MFISQTTYSEDSIYKRQNCNLKLKSSFTNCESDNSGKNHCRNPVQTQETVYCELSRSQRNEASFKAKAKRPTTKNKTKCRKQRKSNSCLRGHRKIVQTRKDIYYSSKQNGKNGFVIVSQRINFYSLSFQIAVYLTHFFCYCFLIKFLKRYLSCGFITSNCKSRISIDPC